MAIFVLYKDHRQEANQAFCLLGLSLAVWDFRHLVLHMAPAPEIALTWIKVIVSASFFIPPSAYHFILAILGDSTRPRRILLGLGYLLSFVCLFLTWGGFLFNGVEYIYGSYFPIISGKEGYFLLAASGLMMGYGIYLLHQRYRTTLDGNEKTRIGYLLLGFVVGGIFSIPSFMLTPEIMHLHASTKIGSAGFTILVAYAIVKHRLLEINFVIRKSLIYTLTTGFVTAIFLVNIIIFGHLFQSVTGFGSLAPSIIAAIFVAFFFQPIREKVHLIVDKFFFRERYDQQQTISHFSQCLVSILDRQELIDSISDVIVSTMHISKVDVLIYDKNRREYVQLDQTPSGRLSSKQAVVLNETQTLVRWLKNEKQPLIRNNLRDYDKKLVFAWNYLEIEWELQQLEAELCMPLIQKNRLTGILAIGKKKSDEFYNQRDINLLTILATEATIALENSNLYQNLKDHMFKTVRALSAAVEAKDIFTNGHCERVVGFAVQMARELRLPKPQIEAIVFGATLHDIGKIGVNEEILLKPAKLSSGEFDVIKTHPLTGAKILKSVDLPKETMDIVMFHHERYDGQGYPYGLKADSIPLVARILSVADSYEAMTSDRVYRPALSKKEALQILHQESGKQFDPQIVEVFISILENTQNP